MIWSYFSWHLTNNCEYRVIRSKHISLGKIDKFSWYSNKSSLTMKKTPMSIILLITKCARYDLVFFVCFFVTCNLCFAPSTPVSSTTETYCLHMTEMLWKVELRIRNPYHSLIILKYISEWIYTYFMYH